jgi:pimeloyl-ACP methyl ester carboxylesterase
MILCDVRIAGADRLQLAGSVAGDPASPPVVMLHGAGQTRHSWKNGQAAIVGAGHYVICYDARGHGESDWDAAGDYGADAFVRDLRAVIGTLEHLPVIVGASLGGLTALLAAGEAEQSLARALVLVDITPMVDTRGAQRVREFMTANPRGFGSLEEVAAAIGRYNPGRPRSSDLSGLRRNVREVDGRLYWHWDPRVLDWGKTKFLRSRLESAAREIDVPILLLRGGDSDLVGAAETQAFHEMLPNLQIVEIPGAGHMIAGDRNDAFNTAIVAFLDRLEGGSAAARDSQ